MMPDKLEAVKNDGGGGISYSVHAIYPKGSPYGPCRICICMDLSEDEALEIVLRFNGYADLLKAVQTSINDMQQPAVQSIGTWNQGMLCGLEDRGINDRYEACQYGYDRAIGKVEEWIIGPLREVLSALAAAKKQKEKK